MAALVYLDELVEVDATGSSPPPICRDAGPGVAARLSTGTIRFA
jgi:hypothetical protein